LVITGNYNEGGMRKILTLVLLLGCFTLLVTAQIYAQAQDNSAIVKKMNSELEKAGAFTPQELRPIESPIKNMLDKGATMEDLKKLLEDLSKKNVKREDLKNTINSMNDLVNSGENPKKAGNIVSRAVHLAHAQGLRGAALAAKVHEAIRQRKMEREGLKQHKKAQKGKGKEEKVSPK
jgi:hypothetical protein